MKKPLNPEHSPLNQDPMGRNSMGSKFNPTPARGKIATFTVLSISHHFKIRLKYPAQHIGCLKAYVKRYKLYNTAAVFFF